MKNRVGGLTINRKTIVATLFLSFVVIAIPFLYVYAADTKATRTIKHIKDTMTVEYIVAVVVASYVIITFFLEFFKKMGWVKSKADSQTGDIFELKNVLMPKGIDFKKTEIGAIIKRSEDVEDAVKDIASLLHSLSSVKEDCKEIKSRLEGCDEHYRKTSRVYDLLETDVGSTPKFWCSGHDKLEADSDSLIVLLKDLTSRVDVMTESIEKNQEIQRMYVQNQSSMTALLELILQKKAV